MSRSMLSYNIHDGAQEGIIHGYKNGILRTEDYSNIAQCDTLEDMKLHLVGCIVRRARAPLQSPPPPPPWGGRLPPKKHREYQVLTAPKNLFL